MPKFTNKLFAKISLKFVVVALIILCFAYLLFFWQLGSLTPGFSPSEKEALNQSADLSKIANNPIFAPHKLFQFGLGQLSDSSFAARTPSVVMALIFLGSFYVIARRWFGKMIAVLSAFLFASLPWIIISARSATPDVMYLSGLALIASILWLPIAEKRKIAFVVFTMVMVISAYTPGLILFIIPAVYLWRQKIKEGAQAAGTLTVIGSLMLLLLGLAPLTWASVQDLGILKSALLISSEFSNPIDIAEAAGWSLISFVWSVKNNHPMILDRLPLLSISTMALSVFGSYIMWKRARIEFFGLFILLFIAIIGYSLNQNLNILTLAFPAFGLLAAAGLRFLYAEWRSIFPLNPIPKTLAIFLVSSLVILNTMYGMRYALAAWPNNQATKSTYVLK